MKSVADYKDKVASRYVPVDPEQIGMKIIEADYYLASVKHDGYFGVLIADGGVATLYGRNGQALKVPGIAEAGSKLPGRMVLAGEICCFSNGHSGRNFDVTRALADPDKYDLRFGLFDVLEKDGQEPPADPKERYAILHSIAPAEGRIFCIEHKEFTSRTDVSAFYRDAIQQYEGIVVRTSNGVTYKIKPLITLDAVVLGFAESSGDRMGMLREMLLGLMTENGHFQVLAKCGNGFSDDARTQILRDLSPMAVESEYTEVSGAKTAFVMVKPEKVVEISCLDLLSEAGQAPIRKPLLSFNPAKGWRVEGNRNTLSCISPVFLRFRTDKSVQASETGFAQAASYATPAAEISGASERQEASQIIRREVYTKAGKGGTAVRKLIALKTNKESSGDYAPFVVVYTDYSAGRATPLEQEIYLCGNDQEAFARFVSLRDENIKKGWESAGGGTVPESSAKSDSSSEAVKGKPAKKKAQKA